MKRFLMTTALVAFATTPVFAQTSPEAPATNTGNQQVSTQGGAGSFLERSGETTIYGSEFIGKNVYVTADESRQATIDGVPDGWENVASVEDVLMTREGEVRGILVDVGGFLGIGAQTVAIGMNELDIVYDREADDFYVVFTSSREELEAAPEYDRTADMAERGETWDMTGAGTATEQPATGTMAQDGTVQQPATDTMAQDDTGEPIQRIDREEARMTDPDVTDPTATDQRATGAETGLGVQDGGYTAAARGELTVDDLKAAEVFGATDERISGVSDVVVTENGEVTAILIDVGGFLGIGARTVAIDYNEVELFHGADPSDLRVHLPMTREQLEELPEYDG